MPQHSRFLPFYQRQRASLYITYDGLLDPLGSSQIIPYLKSLSTHGFSIHVLSFEKPSRYRSHSAQLRSELSNYSITWTPLRFTDSLGLLGKVWDLSLMFTAAIIITLFTRPAIVHARSHPPAQTALILKKLFRTRFLFDCRGLWVDERVDKGSWDLSRPWHWLQFKIYKSIERILLEQSDHIVVLTEAVIPELITLGVRRKELLTVIPCCADFEHFQLASPATCKASRELCGISSDALVLGYLGSVGGMYLPDRFLKFFELATHLNDNVEALVLTPDYAQFRLIMNACLPLHLHQLVNIRSANRVEVPQFLNAMNLLVAFAKPSYSRISMSPTKLAEAWASGLPTIVNHGVGDVTSLVHKLDAGAVIDASSDADLMLSINSMPCILNKGGLRLRNMAREVVGLEVAAQRYSTIYRTLTIPKS